MDTITIGGDRTVHRLGFGAMHLTGPGRDPAKGRKILRRAVELGIDFVDTADWPGQPGPAVDTARPP